MNPKYKIGDVVYDPEMSELLVIIDPYYKVYSYTTCRRRKFLCDYLEFHCLIYTDIFREETNV